MLPIFRLSVRIAPTGRSGVSSKGRSLGWGETVINEPSREKRRHERFAVDKKARTTAGDSEYDGNVVDISASGAAIKPEIRLDIGDDVEIYIDDFGHFAGRIARTADDELFAVEFDLEDGDEDDLLAELRQVHDGISREEY